jgi:hypothetical protein
VVSIAAMVLKSMSMPEKERQAAGLPHGFRVSASE